MEVVGERGGRVCYLELDTSELGVRRWWRGCGSFCCRRSSEDRRAVSKARL